MAYIVNQQLLLWRHRPRMHPDKIFDHLLLPFPPALVFLTLSDDSMTHWFLLKQYPSLWRPAPLSSDFIQACLLLSPHPDDNYLQIKLRSLTNKRFWCKFSIYISKWSNTAACILCYWLYEIVFLYKYITMGSSYIFLSNIPYCIASSPIPSMTQ